MRIGPIVVVAFAATLAATTFAGAATVTSLYNTGVDASGVPLPDSTINDPHYNLVSVPGGSTTVTLVRTSAGGFPIPPYLADDLLSAWIGPANAHDLNGPVGFYDYQTTFSLAGFNAATASITGQWSSDNEGFDILINGASTSNPNPNLFAFESWKAFSISSGFLPGLNTLDFIVFNDSVDAGPDNPTALRVEMSGNAALAATPLPGALALFAGGLGVIGLVAGRKKRKTVGLAAA